MDFTLKWSWRHDSKGLDIGHCEVQADSMLLPSSTSLESYSTEQGEPSISLERKKKFYLVSEYKKSAAP